MSRRQKKKDFFPRTFLAAADTSGMFFQPAHFSFNEKKNINSFEMIESEGGYNLISCKKKSRFFMQLVTRPSLNDMHNEFSRDNLFSNNLFSQNEGGRESKLLYFFQ